MKTFPLSSAQTRILTTELRSPGTTAYNIPLSFSFAKEDKPYVKQALTAVARGNLLLRMHKTAQMDLEQYYGDFDESCFIEHELEEASEHDVTRLLSRSLDYVFPTLFDAPLYRFDIIYTAKEIKVIMIIHHLIFDGTSCFIFANQLQECIDALRDGKEWQLAKEDYQNYISAESRYIESNELQTDKEYWVKTLADLDEYPPAFQTTDDLAIEEASVEIPAEIARKLQKITDAKGKPLSPFVIASSLFSLYVARSRRARGAVLSSGYAGRDFDDESIKKMRGMFVNLLPLNFYYQPKKPVSEFLTEGKDILKQGLTHGRVSLNHYASDLTNNDIDVKSLFNYSIVSNSVPSDKLPCNLKVLSLRHSEFPLTVRVNLDLNDKNGLRDLRFEYRKDCFNQRQIMRMMQNFKTMIAHVANNPNLRCNEIAIISESEQNLLLNDFQGRKLDYDKKSTLIDLFRAHAKARPQNPAVADEDGAVTYAEADSFTDSLAAELISSGVKPEQFVAIMLPRKREFALAALAVMKAVAAYLPIDPEYPRERIAYMLADSKAPVLLTTRELIKETEVETSAKTIFMEDYVADDRKPAASPKPQNLAYIIYTSGSTGNPKGVMIEHRSLAATCAWVRDCYQLKPADAASCYASFSFDASVIDLFPILSAGGCIHIIGDAMRFDMKLLDEYLREHNIKECCFPTKFGMEYLRAFEPPLKYLMVGGEKLKQLPKRSLTLLNGYGPTEFTVASSFHVVDQDKHYANIPIGAPVPNSWNYVVDSNNRLVPIGTPGELLLSGMQISRGYLDRPETTAERFVDNPFSTCAENEKMYHTGDLVCWNEDGELEFLGRIDSQVKLRGFRIELGEIEAAVNAFKGVTNAAATVKNDTLLAYFTSSEEINEEDLRAALSARMPAYMVPSFFIRVDEFPMTPGGKLDYKKLPAPERKETASEEIVPPTNPTEQQIFDLVAEVLQHSEFGVSTDLFKVGMSSLLAIKIAARISDDFGVSFNARHVMAGKTILAMVNALLKLTDKDEKHYQKRKDYPLTQSQMGVYYDCAREPDTLKYNIPFAVSLSKKVEVKRLKAAVAETIEKHPYLKTYLRMKAQNVCQVRFDDAAVVIETREGSAKELAELKKTFVRPFRLFTGPLYRLTIFSAPEEVCLLGDFHHIICDGASIDVLLRHIATLYNGGQIVAESFTSFDMAIEEKEIEESELWQQAEEYFAERLKNCEGATVIAPDISGDEHQGSLCEATVEVDRDLVTDHCRKLGVTAGNLFLAGVSYSISRFTNTDSILISTISNGRSEARYQNNVGMLVRTLPLVVDVKTATAVDEYIKQTQQAMFSTLAHECYPFTRIAEKYKFSPQLMFAFQSGVVSEIVMEDQPAKIETLELKKPKFKLSVHIEDGKDSYKIAVQYNDAIYSAKLMQTFAECSALAVERMIRAGSDSLARISLVSQAQQQQLDSFNQTSGEVPIKLLHGMFEAVVDKTPDAKALIAIDRTLTYEELNQQANKIAWSLFDKGVELEDRVAFILPRDSRLIATMLGIVKAGAAYIPIDPEYPAERIAHVLENSRARYVISTSAHKSSLPTDKMLNVDELLTHKRTQNPQVEVKPENLCYLIYTSGSTGTPKGVMLTHEGITNYITALPQNPHVYALANECHTMLSITTVSFDMFLKESFTTLMNGLTLAFASEEQGQNPQKLAEFFAQTQADAFNATPSRLLQYLESPALQQAVAKCKVVMGGGEGYPAALFKKLRSMTQATMFNTYGPTEITVSCNAKKLVDENISIGPPLLNVVEHVMDSDGNPLPAGVMGELYVGGAGVARGYWANEKMTAEKFVTINGQRMYKTGDYARWTDNGEIVILGRTDNQIKLRGLRIELGEIESAIAKYDGIKAVVVVIRKINDTEHICAYFTADSEVKIEALRDFIAQSLTRYMVPTAYMQLDAMPTTPNGKTDVKALPEPIMMAQAQYVAPENRNEEIFCKIFENVLGLSRVGALDNFFDLGGTSLQVTRVTIEAMNEGLQISYGDLFTHPSPCEIAALVAGDTVEQKVDDSPVVAKCADSSIESVLQRNNLENFIKGDQRHLGNILLTGATGFLGIHVLKSFIEKEKGSVYCLMRRGRHKNLESRLKGLLVYYFNQSYDELFNTRIFAIEGDVTSVDDFDAMLSTPVDTVINCAAVVKHFASGTQISDVNVKGVENCIEFSLKKGCRLIQVSTTSVAGLSVEGEPPADTAFDERMLYVGQNIENKYIHSKFIGEDKVLRAINRGLDAKIMRVGNLMARNRDGEFQINFNTNGFVNRLKAYHAIGCISYSAMGGSTELAPIDCTAEAILLLGQAPRECCLFHPYNYHYIYISDIIEAMNRHGLNIETVEDDVFQDAFAHAMKDKRRATELAGIIAYLNMGRGRKVSFLHTVNNYTIQALYRYKFQWPLTNDDYLDKFIGSLKDLGFFDWRDKNA